MAGAGRKMETMHWDPIQTKSRWLQGSADSVLRAILLKHSKRDGRRGRLSSLEVQKPENTLVVAFAYWTFQTVQTPLYKQGDPFDIGPESLGGGGGSERFISRPNVPRSGHP
jgi:hypothetical protein